MLVMLWLLLCVAAPELYYLIDLNSTEVGAGFFEHLGPS